MKVHLRADSADGTHTRFTVFMNGANCGQLCMTEKEAVFFHDALINSNWLLKRDEVISSGRWMKNPEGRKPQ
jgi:hypothetical protein